MIAYHQVAPGRLIPVAPQRQIPVASLQVPAQRPAPVAGAAPAGATVRVVGRVVRWTPFGADVAFAPPPGAHPGAGRPVWVPAGLVAVRVEAVGCEIGVVLPGGFAAERGLL